MADVGALLVHRHYRVQMMLAHIGMEGQQLDQGGPILPSEFLKLLFPSLGGQDFRVVFVVPVVFGVDFSVAHILVQGILNHFHLVGGNRFRAIQGGIHLV